MLVMLFLSIHQLCYFLPWFLTNYRYHFFLFLACHFSPVGSFFDTRTAESDLFIFSFRTKDDLKTILTLPAKPKTRQEVRILSGHLISGCITYTF
jgi:hypothetical protein